jgi:hypothetical protein
VVNEETGEPVGGVVLINFTISADEALSQATVHLVNIPCEIVTDARAIDLAGLAAPNIEVEDDDFFWTFVRQTMTEDAEGAEE